MNCRHCSAPLVHTFLDLGFAPPSNAYLGLEDLSQPESYYPLRIKVCDTCWLVQTEDCAEAESLFNDKYAYFSSTSSSWLAHAKRFSRAMIDTLGLTGSSHVVEVASNDGYLLRNFVDADIPCLGIEPTASTAAVAEKLGVPVLREFFGKDLGEMLAANGQQADLVIGNNVFAHVPDINDFSLGLKSLLKPGGTITLEFPHFMRLVTEVQFDTVYHEHFSYLSLFCARRIFASAGLRLFRVEELPTHGGSLRVFGCHDSDPRETHESVEQILLEEYESGLRSLETYTSFQARADKVKGDLLTFLLEKKSLGKKVVAYGAAAKGNTLLNYAGIKPDLLPVVFDAAKAKQGSFMPGSHIPIRPVDELASCEADYVLVLPWNIAHEIVSQTAAWTSPGTQFVVLTPQLRFLTGAS